MGIHVPLRAQAVKEEAQGPYRAASSHPIRASSARTAGGDSTSTATHPSGPAGPIRTREPNV
jgi:hypothetical protein